MKQINPGLDSLISTSLPLSFTIRQSLQIDTSFFPRLTNSVSFLTEINTISKVSSD